MWGAERTGPRGNAVTGSGVSVFMCMGTLLPAIEDAYREVCV